MTGIPVGSIQIADYDYPLPDERIARYPLAERDSSQLLVYRDGAISDSVFRNLTDYLPSGSLLVFNNTRVIQARMRFNKDTGARIEVFCLEPQTPHDYQLIFSQTGSCEWQCMIGNLKKWKDGVLVKEIAYKGESVSLRAERSGEVGNSHIVSFSWSPAELTFADILDAFGELPIPPYLNRGTEESDKTTYQTVYSKIKGSVAAPTAGLHFTERVLDDLDAKGFGRAEVTLHVGAGTFQPVKSDTIGDHPMHTETIELRRDVLARIRESIGSVIAVGTTSVRTLESVYYIGNSLAHGDRSLFVPQWMPYEAKDCVTPSEAVDALIAYMDENGLDIVHASTQIIIAPGYRFHIVGGIITNFHQPKSTLLLLLAAYVGEKWRDIYRHAMDHGYRFLSYGDSSLLLNSEIIR